MCFKAFCMNDCLLLDASLSGSLHISEIFTSRRDCSSKCLSQFAVLDMGVDQLPGLIKLISRSPQMALTSSDCENRIRSVSPVSKAGGCFILPLRKKWASRNERRKATTFNSYTGGLASSATAPNLAVSGD